MRVMVKPDPGMVLVEADQSQAEARVVAYAGHIKFMMDVFAHDPSTPEGDIHRHTAALIYEKLVAEIDKKSDERYSAKRIVHACDYDMHANTFAKRYNKDAADQGKSLISIQEAARLLNLYHLKVPELRNNYHALIKQLLETTKTLTNPFDRRIIFHDRVGQDLFRQGYAWYAQSTVGDITNIILEAIYKYIDVLLQVHDSVLWQCRHDEVKDTIKLIKSANPTFSVGGVTLQIPIEYKVSDVSWYDMQDYKEAA